MPLLSMLAEPEEPTMIWGREPVLVLAVVETIIALVVAFGLDLTAEQVGGIMAVSAAVLGFIARSQVTPVDADEPPSPVG